MKSPTDYSIFSKFLVRMTCSLPGVVLLFFSIGAYAQADDQADARRLVENAQNSLAVVVSAAQQDPSLNADASKAKPFWNGLQDLGKNLDSAKAGLDAQDDRFFTGTASANASFVQAHIALLMMGNQNESISNAMASVGGSLEALAMNFSREAARLKQGGELTAEETRQLDTLIAQMDELMRKLDEVEKNVAQNNAEMKAGIAKIREEARKLRQSRRNVGGFAAGWWSAHIIYDWLWGWHWWWGPWGGWCPGYIDVGIIIWDDWGGDFDYDWDLVDTYAEVDELEFYDIEDAVMAESMDYLDAGDFSFDGDLADLTDEIDAGGWDDVDTDSGFEIMEQFESNFDNSSIYDVGQSIETFDDFGMDDFGGGFDSDMDFGGFDMDFDAF